MTRRSWIYTPDGKIIEKGSAEHFDYLGEQVHGPMVFQDEGEFVSPIDHKVYSGKSGMREHNARHDVVNNRDLKGLPEGFTGKPAPRTTRQREELRQAIYTAALKGGHLEGQ